ncbi:hypothetical protein Sa4125_18400 [Aureimonas sp. SA4125]|nr:hypothetical protein Sa4125_18400 [Aureimonas sp. SA4125]
MLLRQFGQRQLASDRIQRDLGFEFRGIPRPLRHARIVLLIRRSTLNAGPVFRDHLSLSEGVATKTHVLNILHRLIDGKTIDGPAIDTPQTLLLRREPKANVERYDDLRARRSGGRHAS